MSAVDTAWLLRARDRSWTCEGVPDEVVAFHQSLDGYAPTPLVSLPFLADELGVARVLLKDESSRLGLPAFKALGASWAIHRALAERDAALGPALLVTATDGNHGRAVARFARLLGHRAHIVIPVGVHPVAIAAIESEGATVTMVEGSYDDAVAAAAEVARVENGILVQDTAWPSYETIPAWIVEGYATLFAEVDEQLAEEPSLVIVPVGVGSLAQAAVTHYRRSDCAGATAVVSVEPETAACVLASLRVGEAVSIPTSYTVMAGLNCGTPSSLAWPLLEAGLDGAVAVTDSAAQAAVRELEGQGLRAGPCGGAGVAAARVLLVGEGADARRSALGITSESTVVLLVTEGSEANPA